MSELLTMLALLAYGTAGVVGMHMMAGSIARLAGLDRGPLRRGYVRRSASSAGNIILLLAGLFLSVQAAIVVLWTVS